MQSVSCSFYVLWLCFLLWILDEVDFIQCQLSHDRDTLLISTFCQPRIYSHQAAMSDEKYNPLITWFKLSAGAQNMLDCLYKWSDSAVFLQIWKAQLSQVGVGTKLTFDQIERNIWQRSYNIWDAFCRGMVCYIYM